MKTNLTLLKWFLAAGICLLPAGCGSNSVSQAVNDALSKKERALQTIDKIKAEKQLGLVEYEIQKIIKAKEDGRFLLLIKTEKSILCSCKAYLKAGIDLDGFDPMTDVAIDPEETMITLTLPSPTLLSLNMPINEVDVLYEKATNTSQFTLADVNNLLRQGEEQIRESVSEIGIIDDAKRNARLFFEPLFKHLGFAVVQVNFKESQTKDHQTT